MPSSASERGDKESPEVVNVISLRVYASHSVTKTPRINSSPFKTFLLSPVFIAKPIYRFKTVCKSSSEFSTNKLFAWTQARNLHVKDDSGFFIQPSISTGPSIVTKCAPKSLQFLENTGSKVLASSNGLILCQNTKTPDDHNLFLCNPTTQTWLTIPTPQGLGGVNWPKGVVLECNINNPISDPDHQDYMLLIIQPPRD
ncbi:unnamed protein product [Prunus armeniaca]